MGDPGVAPQGHSRRRTQRLRSGKPRPQGARRDPRDVSSRRAFPDSRGRALVDRARDPPPRRAPAGTALRAARDVRPLLLLSRLPPARPLQHRRPAADRADPPGCFRRQQRRLRRTRLRVRARTTAPRRPHGAGQRRRLRRRGDRSPARRSHAHVVRRPPRCSDRAARRGARRLVVSPLRGRVPGRVPGGLQPPSRGRRHPADRASRPRGRSRPEPLPTPRVAGRTPGVQATALRRPDPPLRRAAAAGEHGRQGDRRATVRGAAARQSSGLDLRLRTRLR